MKTKLLNELKIGQQFRLIHPQDDVQGGEFRDDVINSETGYIICHDMKNPMLRQTKEICKGKPCYAFFFYTGKYEYPRFYGIQCLWD